MGGGGGQVKFPPYEKGGGGQKKCWVSFRGSLKLKPH